MSMQSVASPAIALTPPKRNSLTHIPGDEGWPLIGKTLEVLADPKGHVERHAAKYGLVYRNHVFGETSLVLLGPEEDGGSAKFSRFQRVRDRLQVVPGSAVHNLHNIGIRSGKRCHEMFGLPL